MQPFPLLPGKNIRITFDTMKRMLSRKVSVAFVAVLVLAGVALSTTTVLLLQPAAPVTKVIKPGDKIIDTVSGDTIVVADTSAFGRLKAAVDSITNAPELVGGSWSFRLVTADSLKSIYEHNPDQALVPASVMKVVNTGTALAMLGPGQRFSTSLQYDGKIDAATRTLLGNLYIRGGGDPALGAATFGSSIGKVMGNWREAVSKLGIDSIAGCIIGDAESGERDMIPLGWAWEDMQSDYGIGPCPLSINENGYDLYLTPSGNGVSIKTSPQIPGLRLYNQAIHSSGVKSYAYVAGAPYQFERVVMGEVSSYLEARSAIPDPPLYCAQRLSGELAEAGIKLRDSATTMRRIRFHGQKLEKSERKSIYTSMSPSLSELVYHTNQVSHNYYAESILRGISYARSGYGSTSGGIAQIISYWKDKGIDMRGFCMVDGSGISRYNTVSARQLTGMLSWFAKDSALFKVFYRSLPVAGESGTIRKLATESAAEGNLHAKSGTMSRVKSYAGYVRTKSGKLLTFAMTANNTGWDAQQLRAKFERLFILMAELP